MRRFLFKLIYLVVGEPEVLAVGQEHQCLAMSGPLHKTAYSMVAGFSEWSKTEKEDCQPKTEATVLLVIYPYVESLFHNVYHILFVSSESLDQPYTRRGN